VDVMSEQTRVKRSSAKKSSVRRWLRRGMLGLSCLALSTSLCACSPAVNLDDQTFNHYILAMRNLQQSYPDLARKLQTEGTLSLQNRDVDRLEDSVKAAGFHNLSEFIQVNSAVAWTITRIKSQQTMQNQQLNLKKGLEQLSDDLARIKTQSGSWWNTLSHQFTQPANKKGVDVVEKNFQKLKQIFS